MIECLVHKDFNSIKVRLEQSLSEMAEYAQFVFQFHKGAIRTSLSEMADYAQFVFQFHKGAIRTECGRVVLVDGDISIP